MKRNLFLMLLIGLVLICSCTKEKKTAALNVERVTATDK
jgi:hypothetical protein